MKICFDELELVFENVEAVKIPKEYCDVYFCGVETSHVFQSHMDRCGSEDVIVGHIYIDDIGKIEFAHPPINDLTPLERLIKYNDIAQVHLLQNGKSVKMFYVKYDDDKYENNKLQKTTYDVNNGKLHIEIKRPRKQT